MFSGCQLLPFPAIGSTFSGMDSMNISLPSALKDYVDGQVAEGRYSSVSEYVRDLIRKDEKAKAWLKLEGLLLEGLEGEPTPWTDVDANRLIRLAETGH